ncbi:MAG TPA: hypothetical protein VFQ39_03415 [Longimicrobium sp.]|nr:hypothetical protein [Longimicrobium sp.]
MRSRFLYLIAVAVALAGCQDRGAQADGAPSSDSAGQASTQVAEEPPVVDAPPSPAIDPDSLQKAATEGAGLSGGAPPAPAPAPATRTYAQCMAEASKAPADERAVLENTCRGLPGKRR